MIIKTCQIIKTAKQINKLKAIISAALYFYEYERICFIVFFKIFFMGLEEIFFSLWKRWLHEKVTNMSILFVLTQHMVSIHTPPCTSTCPDYNLDAVLSSSLPSLTSTFPPSPSPLTPPPPPQPPPSLFQSGCRAAPVIQSPASRTPPCGGNSSSSSAGSASTRRAAAACRSNCTTSGGCGCRKRTERATR